MQLTEWDDFFFLQKLIRNVLNNLLPRRGKKNKKVNSIISSEDEQKKRDNFGFILYYNVVLFQLYIYNSKVWIGRGWLK